MRFKKITANPGSLEKSPVITKVVVVVVMVVNEVPKPPVGCGCVRLFLAIQSIPIELQEPPRMQ